MIHRDQPSPAARWVRRTLRTTCLVAALAATGAIPLFAADGNVTTHPSTINGDTTADHQEVEALPVGVPMTDRGIRLMGRFDTSKPTAPRCSWSASTVYLHFKGTAVNVLLSDGPNARYEVVIDGAPSGVLKVRAGAKRYRVAAGLTDAEHTVVLVRRVEALFGTTTFEGFELAAGGSTLPAAPAPDRRIEVVGDSISCGYGNEAANQNEHFTAETENAYLTYGAIAARALGADYTCVAWSGKKMWPDNTMPELFDRTLPSDPRSRWDHASWVPQVVVVTLGTNDFGRKIPPEQGWTQVYEAFLAHVRELFPEATIYCASSPMMFDGGTSKSRTTLNRYLAKIVSDRHSAGDAKVRQLDFAVQDSANGLGADWHPSTRTHAIMAETLVKAIENDLRWDPVRRDAAERQ